MSSPGDSALTSQPLASRLLEPITPAAVDVTPATIDLKGELRNKLAYNGATPADKSFFMLKLYFLSWAASITLQPSDLQ